MVTYMRLPNGKSILEILGNPMLRTTVTGGIGSLILGLSLLNLKKNNNKKNGPIHELRTILNLKGKKKLRRGNIKSKQLSGAEKRED